MVLNTNKLMLVISQAPYWLCLMSNPKNDHYEIYIISLSKSYLRIENYLKCAYNSNLFVLN